MIKVWRQLRLFKWKSVAAASSLSFLLPLGSGTYEYCKFSELTSVADPKQKFWLDPVSDPDPAEVSFGMFAIFSI